MPKPIETTTKTAPVESTTDPTPAKALQMADKGRKACKTTDGSAKTNNVHDSLIRPISSKHRQQQSQQSSPAKANHITNINATGTM
jgi:hypothetical protein